MTTPADPGPDPASRSTRDRTRHEFDRAVPAFMRAGYSQAVAEHWATSVVFGRDWQAAAAYARQYLAHGIPSSQSWQYYELDIDAYRAKQLHRRGWTPTTVTALRYALELRLSRQAERTATRSGPPRDVPSRTERLERLERDWIELHLPPKITIRYAEAGIALKEIADLEESRADDADAHKQALETLITLRRQVP